MRRYRQEFFLGIFMLAVFVVSGLLFAQQGLASETPQLTITPSQGRVYEAGDVCFGRNYVEANGIAVGGRGQIVSWNQSQMLWDDIQSQNEVGSLQPLDILEVIDGPVCWTDYPLSTSTALTKPRRFWLVQSEQMGLEGWIKEYVRSIIGTRYLIAPLGADDHGVVAGQALSHPIVLEGVLPDGRATFHDNEVVFVDYGYITFDLQIESPHPTCAIEGFITDSALSVKVTTDSMQLGQDAVERVLVEPRAYGLRLIATNNGTPTLRVQDLDCDGLRYILTIYPA